MKTSMRSEMKKEREANNAAALQQAIEHEAKKTPVYFVDEMMYVEEKKAFRVAIVIAGEDCYHPTGNWPYHGHVGETMPYFFGPTIEKAREAVEHLNARIGVTPEIANVIVMRSMTRKRW